MDISIDEGRESLWEAFDVCEYVDILAFAYDDCR